MEELPGVLWAYRTTARKSTGISPFAFAYGMEVVIPTEVGLPIIRTDTPDSENAESIVRELDVSDELWEATTIRIASYQRRLASSYNRWVKPGEFQPGDLVLRKVFENTADLIARKFKPN